MARDSRTQHLPENFYSTVSHDTNLMMRSSSKPNKISQFHRDLSTVPAADLVFPMNNSSVMQNFRQNFVNELERSLPTRASSSQKRISEYFPEVKNLEAESSAQGARTKKRSLQELKMKYDSVQNMVANLSKEATCTEPVTVENETATRAKRSRYSTQNENTIARTSSKSQMVPVAAKGPAIVKKVKNEQEISCTPTFIHLVGYVDNILRWSHILQDSKIFVIYNVLGYFISSMEGIHSKEKFVYIRSNTGIILECSYFEIDRPVPQIPKDQFVGCFGHPIGPQRFRLFSIDVMEDTHSTEIRRLLYLSQRITHELSNRKFN